MDEAAFHQEFVRRVRRRREVWGMKQVDVAEQIGMDASQYSRLEKGDVRLIRPAHLAQLAQALHTTVDYLLSRSDDPGIIPPEPSPEAEPCHLPDPASRNAPHTAGASA